MKGAKNGHTIVKNFCNKTIPAVGDQTLKYSVMHYFNGIAPSYNNATKFFSVFFMIKT